MYNTTIERKFSMDIQILLFIQDNIRHYILTPFFTLITNEYFLYALLSIVLVYMFKKKRKHSKARKRNNHCVFDVYRIIHCIKTYFSKA